MRIYKFLSLLLICSFFFTKLLLANNNLDVRQPVEFFASNNTSEIDLQTAFNRLKNNKQQELHDEIIRIMQIEQVKQGKFEDLLGTYRMSSDQNITADNSEIFITSFYQKLSTEKVFNLAKKLANSLKQDSVAVFIPSKQSIIGDASLKFKSHIYSINEVTKLIHEKLPIHYSQAFSLYLNNNSSIFDNTTVKEVEWLGSKIKPDELHKSFPQDQVTYHYGKAYLVYRNGQKEEL